MCRVLRIRLLPRPPCQPARRVQRTRGKDRLPFSKFKSEPAAGDADNATADNAQTETPAPSRDEKATERVVVPQVATKTPAAARNVAFPVPPQPTAPATARPPLPATSAQSIVQVSATSRRGDAEALITALQQKGYIAAIRQEPQDKLFHVQIGPFATKVEANAMRKRLDTDGYKAIVK